jgi:hypothetical protein
VTLCHNSPLPPSNLAEDGSIVALKRCTHDFAYQQTIKDYYENDQEDEDTLAIARLVSTDVTNPLCPPSIKAEDGSIAALKRHAHDFTCQQMTHDDGWISYLESVEAHEYDTLMIVKMLAR